MQEQSHIPDTVATVAATLHQRSSNAAALQSKVGKKLAEINQHWLERMQAESTEAWQLLFKVVGTPAVGEKIKLCEQWIEDAMKKAADDSTFVLESACSLGEIGMRCLAPKEVRETDGSPSAAAETK